MALIIRTGDPMKDKIYGKIADMKHKELQAEVLKRGMPFEEVAGGTFPVLSSWLYHHWDAKKDKGKLREYDVKMDALLKERGYKQNDPVRKYKKFEETYSQQEARENKPIKPKVEKPKKEKKKKDAKFGIYEGTKKDYTYKWTQRVYDKFMPKYKNVDKLVKKFAGKVHDKVVIKFPEANAKSVKIWMKRAMETIHAEAKGKTKKD